MTQFPTDFTAYLAKFPTIDFASLMSTQQRNIDAFVAASTVVAETTQAMMKRQAELFQTSFQEGLEAARDSFAGKSLEVNVQKQLDQAKASAEKTLATAREFAEIASKSNTQAIEILRKRATESLGELSQIVKIAA